MALNRLQNDQIKSVGLAFGVSAVAAISAMFVPVGLIESVTGATGISEMIPATAAPLGDKARAIIAFSVGALTLIAALAFIIRQNKSPVMDKSRPVMDKVDPVKDKVRPVLDKDHKDPVGKEDALTGIKARASAISLPKISLPKISLPKMPWTKNEDDILDLADLPRLRSFDAHPDAPARRPLLASSDLSESITQPTLSDAEAKYFGNPVETSVAEVATVAVAVAVATTVSATAAVEPVIEPKPQYAAVVEAEPEVIVPEEPIFEMPAPLVSSEPEPVTINAESSTDGQSLAEMVNQLEAAVVQRKIQLAELEIAAAELLANKSEPVVAAEPRVVADKFAAEILPPEMSRPPLEAVPSSPRAEADDGMDAALNAALETLHRMNAQAR